MKKVTLIIALFFGFAAASFAQTAPSTRWQTQETEAQLKDGVNTVRMADGSVVRFNVRSAEVFNVVVQAGRERVVFEGNDEAPAGAPQPKCPNKFDIRHCYYSTKDKMLVCFCGPVLSDKPSSDPTATKEHILLARQIGVAN